MRKLFIADFENSSMKNSFSMSSLQPSSRICLEQSSQATNGSPVLPNRAYNSLNHKLKLVPIDILLYFFSLISKIRDISSLMYYILHQTQTLMFGIVLY